MVFDLPQPTISEYNGLLYVTEYPKQNKPSEYPNMGSVNIKFSHGYTPLNFYVTTFESRNMLAAINICLQNLMPAHKVPVPVNYLKPEKACVVFNRKSNIWYRAKFIGMDETNNIYLQLVDNGRTVKISNATDIYLLPHGIVTSYEPCAFQCSLKLFKNLEINENCQNFFQQCFLTLEHEELSCIFENENPPFSVILNNNSTSLNWGHFVREVMYLK